MFMRSRRVTIAVLALVAALGSLGSGCGGGDGTGGAAAPARAGSAGGAPQRPATPGDPSATVDYSGNGAERAVTAYFQEINDASRAGRVADVSATALPGCQPCALDVGMTRLFDQRGVRADTAPYDVTGLTGTNPVGSSATVRFTAKVNELRLLDPVGREAGSQAAGPTRTATAQLTLTATGWRIRTIQYTTGAA
jgi:hypothetical protein